jgi:hypothetical protein
MKQPKRQQVDDLTGLLNENLKLVFSELSEQPMPDEITDLLRVLKAQDEASKGKK